MHNKDLYVGYNIDLKRRNTVRVNLKEVRSGTNSFYKGSFVQTKKTLYESIEYFRCIRSSILQNDRRG